MGHRTLTPTRSILPPFVPYSFIQSLSYRSLSYHLLPCKTGGGSGQGLGHDVGRAGGTSGGASCYSLSFLPGPSIRVPAPGSLRVQGQVSREFLVPSRGSGARSEFQGHWLW